MLQIAIVEKEALAKELVFQIGQILHDYAWSFTHYTSLVDMVKAQQEIPFDVVFLNEKFQTKRIYDSLVKDKAYSVVYLMKDDQHSIEYNQAYFVDTNHLDTMILNLKGIVLPMVKRHEEFYISCQDVTIMMKIKDIQYIEKQDKYLIYHTKLGDFKKRGNMSDMATYFKPYGFLHIHISYLVNEMYIFGLHKEELILKDKAVLPISRNKYPIVKSFFDKKQGK